MTAFVIAAALVALLALGFVLRPLWREGRATGAALMLSFGAVASLVYVLVGTPRALDATQLTEPRTLDAAVAQLEQRLRDDPDQVEGWRLLGRALSTQGRAAEARDAFGKAAALAPEDADVLSEAAEARALAAADRNFDATAVALLRQALARQPMHQRARWFLGIAQRQARQPAEAARTWEPLLAIVDSQTAVGLREQINLARAEAGQEPLPGAAPAAATGGLRVTIALDPSLPPPAGATLFVIARQAGGPPMPVAVEKIAAPKFPLEVVLDDSDSPMPTMRLSALKQVEVIARLSSTGDATPRPGDPESRALPVSLPAKAPVALTIDHARD